MLLAPVVRGQKGEFRDVVERLSREGFVRARVDGELVELANGVRIKLDPKEKHTIEAVVDRLVIDEKIRVRLSDSVETALALGRGRDADAAPDAGGRVQSPKSKVQSRGRGRHRPAHARTAPVAPRPHPRLSLDRNPPLQPQSQPRHGQELRAARRPSTSRSMPRPAPARSATGWARSWFSTRAWWCPTRSKSLEQGAVLPWRRGGKRMMVYYKALLRGVAAHYKQSMETP